ncbi:hypothetical protein HZU77_015945 [Neisseriaceae bacterium TC5R-5]|nr:hypothetical protein [Neisseriaceae bacterium TC5R-5]
MLSIAELADYVRQQGLDHLDLTELQMAVMTLSAVWQLDKPALSSAVFRYPVPILNDDGSCSLSGELADAPYDLAPLWAGETPEALALLTNLHALLHSVNNQIAVSWLGIYRKVGKGKEAKLVKLAYQGLPSRAEFPLTEAFAEHSNNSRVGLTGWAVLVDDVAQWQAAGGGYYTCDPKIQSEVCLPILAEDDNVLGVVDAESVETAYFSPQRQVWLAALAIVLAQLFAEPSEPVEEAV